MRSTRRNVLLLAPVVLVAAAGCLSLGGRGGGNADTVLGGVDEVTGAVADVFHEVGLPVERVDPGLVQSGLIRIGDTWGTAPIEQVVACGNDGDIPVQGHIVELRVSAFVAAASDVQPPTTGPVPGVPSQASAGPRSRVSISSDGRMVTRAGEWCTLRDSFARGMLDRVAARTGRGGAIVAGVAETGFLRR